MNVDQSLPWMDLTLRPNAVPEVELQPDNSVELSWPMAGQSRLTILLSPAEAESLNRVLGLKLLMVQP